MAVSNQGSSAKPLLMLAWVTNLSTSLDLYIVVSDRNSVSVSEPKLLQPKPKLQYIDFSEITLSTYVHVLHGKSEIT